MWFIRGSTFEEWKTNGSVLWILGNRALLSLLDLHGYSFLLRFDSGIRQKHPLVCGPSATLMTGVYLLISSAIIEDIKRLQETKSALIAYHYFDFKDATKRHLRGLLSSLLMQLGDHSFGCWDVLYQLYASCEDGSKQASEAALAGCLKNMLELPGQVPIYIIVDALDECPDTTDTPSPRQKVLDFVDDLIGRNHSSLYICITSRPEQDIQATLNPLTSTSRRVSLHEEVGQREDINNYILSFVHSNKTMRRWRDEDKELVINTLSERAGGM